MSNITVENKIGGAMKNDTMVLAINLMFLTPVFLVMMYVLRFPASYINIAFVLVLLVLMCIVNIFVHNVKRGSIVDANIAEIHRLAGALSLSKRYHLTIEVHKNSILIVNKHSLALLKTKTNDLSRNHLPLELLEWRLTAKHPHPDHENILAIIKDASSVGFVFD